MYGTVGSMPITVNKVEGDGLEYRYTFTARADGGVTFRRSLEQSRGGGIVEIPFTEDEWVELTKKVADESAGLRSVPEELKLLPTDGVNEARAKWGVLEAERIAEEARRAAAAAKARADREAEEAAEAKRVEAKRVADEAELVAAAARAKADKEAAEADAAKQAELDAAAALAKLDAEIAGLSDEDREALKADCERQVEAQSKVPGGPPAVRSAQFLERLKVFEAGRADAIAPTEKSTKRRGKKE